MKIIKYTNGLTKLLIKNPKRATASCNTINSDRREIGLQLANYEERKRIQITRQRRIKIYEDSIDTGVWLG